MRSRRRLRIVIRMKGETLAPQALDDHLDVLSSAACHLVAHGLSVTRKVRVTDTVARAPQIVPDPVSITGSVSVDPRLLISHGRMVAQAGPPRASTPARETTVGRGICADRRTVEAFDD